MDTNSSLALTCMVIDDEQAAHTALTRLIDSVPWLRLTGQCFSGTDAAQLMRLQHPDLIFLDIKMPGMNGLDLLRTIEPPKPQVILTTAFRDYAYEAYQNDASAFLLKPINKGRFHSAVHKVKELMQLRAAHVHKPANQPAADNWNPEPLQEQVSVTEDDSIWLYSGKKFHHFKFDEIYAIEGLKDYVKAHSSQGIFLVKGNIGSMERKLPPSRFVRIHRSYIVNRSAIRLIEGNMVKMSNGMDFTIPSSKKRESIINKLLNRQRLL